jgi:hypothetical protein
MPSATNLISFLRSVEVHRTRELLLEFAREVLSSMEADFICREQAPGPILIASDGSMTA